MAGVLMLDFASAALAVDTYNAGQLTMPSLRIGRTTFSNVVVTVGFPVSGPTGTSAYGDVDTYGPVSGQLTNNGSGPAWVASLVSAIGNSANWANTAIIITWDDWGGWYVHVAPKVVNDGVSWGSGYTYGFRVPLIVVSPYAKAQYISPETHDFGSILK